MKTLKRFGILTAVMATALLLIPAGTADARYNRGGGGVNVWVGPGGVGYSRGYGGYYRGYYGGNYRPYYRPYYYRYPYRSYYYSYPAYGGAYYSTPCCYGY